MTKIIAHIEYTRTQILKRAKKVSAYFSSGGGETFEDASYERQLAWTSEEQIKRAKEFRKIAKELAESEKRAA